MDIRAKDVVGNEKNWMEKYGSALKTLLPLRCIKHRDENIIQNNDIGCCSYISVNWMNSIMWKASRNRFEPNEVGNIDDPDGVQINTERLARLWNDDLEKYGPKKASLHRTVWRFNRFRLIVVGIMMALFSVFTFVGPAWILEDILEFIGNSEQPVWFGIVLVIALAITQLLRNMAFNAMWIVAVNAGVKLNGALQVLIYNKILQMKGGSGEKFIAKVINYSTSDIERIFQSMHMSMLIVGAPVMWALTVVYSYLLIGPWSLLGSAILLLYYPFMIVVGNTTSKLRTKAVSLTDKRIGLMNQVLTNIKLIKMNAWEEAMAMKVQDVRQTEEKFLQDATFLQSMSWTTSPIMSMIAPMASIFGLVLCGENLTAVQAFTLMSVYSATMIGLQAVPISVKTYSEGKVGCDRIQKMLLSENYISPTSSDNINGEDDSVNIIDASVGWDEPCNEKADSKFIVKSKKIKENRLPYLPQSEMSILHNVARNSCSLDSTIPLIYGTGKVNQVLTNINLNIKKGQLVGICGSVGSGKSTLLSAISGCANVLNGNINVQGSIALVTQTPFIFNDTIMKNIIFGLPFEEQRYNFVVYACSLETDFKLMTNGDQSEIGERGVNLSGGQKQRISLARALYSDRSIYLLDDTLSAVDVKVAKHIFQNCIKNGLRGKTVLLVTHAVQFLKLCDEIICLKNGEIIERGTHDTLIVMEGEYYQMVLTDKQQRGENKDKNNDDEIQELEKHTGNDDFSGEAPMIKAEIDRCVSLTWETWLYFCKKAGGYTISVLTFCTIILFNLAFMFNIIWLQIWLDAGSGIANIHVSAANISIFNYSCLNVTCENSTKIPGNNSTITSNPQLNMYLIVYGISAFIIILIGIVKGFSIGKTFLAGASALHRTMFWKVIRSPMCFFDTTPLGRIVNRFSKDMDELDSNIPYMIEFVTQTIMLVVFQFILVGVYFPWYFLALVIAFVLFGAFDQYLNSGVRETKRVDNLLRPPLLVHMQTTIQGLSIIRSYEKQELFAEKFRNLVNRHLSAYMLFHLSSKWLAFRADALGWIFLTGTAFLITFAGNVSPAIAGLAMVQLFRICGVISVQMRWKSELSARLISIERISDYCKNLTEEAPSIVENNRPPVGWPSKGSISFNNVRLRYQPGLPLVLHGVTVHINGGEKVGIIGRTGAGKSSVIATLLRLTEMCEGTILIDGLDISTIGLQDLRSKIAVISQEPALLEGSIRWNLDPFNKCTDEAIWDALDKTNLKSKVVKQTLQLETIMNAEGEIFSMGEKQLFCLARGFLMKCNILLLDEATASVDVETDQVIQKAIRNAFSHCTVLTIAHRLNTIFDYDKIMTMDAGKVIEFDSPTNLMGKNSLFRTMMQSMMKGN